MKKLLLSLLGVGLGLSLLGFAFLAAGGFRPIGELESRFSLRPRPGDAARYDTPRAVTKTVDAAALQSVTLSLVNADLQVKPGSGSSATLRYEEAYAGEWNYDFSGSALTLRSGRYGRGWLSEILSGLREWEDGFEDGGSDAVSVVLTLPKGCAPALSVTGVNGSCTVGDAALRSLKVRGTNSRIRVSGVASAGSFAVHAANGDAQIAGCSAPSLDIDGMVNAGCTVTGCDFGAISASNQINNTVVIGGLRNPDDYSLRYNTVNGSVTYNGVGYSGSGVLSGGTAGNGKRSIDYQGVNSSLKVAFG